MGPATLQSPPVDRPVAAPLAPPTTRAATGVLCALGAYSIWGFVVAYFKAVGHVNALTILAHRALWSLPLVVGLALLSGGWPRMRTLIANKRTLRILPITALLLLGNWGGFVYCTITGRILQASLAYYITPLVMTGLGIVVLGERLRPLQWTGIGIATAGVIALSVEGRAVPWLALLVAGSWSTYSLLRKTYNVPAIEGLAVELSLFWPLAIGWLLLAGPLPTVSPNSPTVDWLLLSASGVITAAPLLLFGVAATRVNLTTIGFLSYLGPTIQLLLGVLVFDEEFKLAFVVIWIALLIYSVDAWRHAGKRKVAGERVTDGAT